MERDVLKATTTNLKDQLRMMTDSSSALTNNLSAKESDLQKQILELQGAKELQVARVVQRFIVISETEIHIKDSVK